ncbi:STAS domain-containing protein [Niveibacterium terrae]|uniref:STAS domain-containing protein n=1 Tax=Niveibacterium terrae TaxID=3373598 RepID=UPI003A915B75
MSPNPNSSARLALEGEMTIFQAAELNETLLRAVRDNEGLEVDLVGVTELDTAGVQLMLVAQREACALGHALRWVGHSHAVREVVSRLGLEGELGEAVSIVGA